MPKTTKPSDRPKTQISATSPQSQLGAILLSLFGLIFVGTVVFHWLENWTWIESLYFTVVTITTVGYGDITPTTDESRLVAIVYILAGVGLAAAALSTIGKSYLNRQESHMNIRKYGRKKK